MSCKQSSCGRLETQINFTKQARNTLKFISFFCEHAHKVKLEGHTQEQTYTHTHTQTTVPFHLSTPEDVLLVVHEDGEMLVFPLLHRVGACRYRTQLLKLELTSRTKHTHKKHTNTDRHTHKSLFNPTASLLLYSSFL